MRLDADRLYAIFPVTLIAKAQRHGISFVGPLKCRKDLKFFRESVQAGIVPMSSMSFEAFP